MREEQKPCARQRVSLLNDDTLLPNHRESKYSTEFLTGVFGDLAILPPVMSATKQLHWFCRVRANNPRCNSGFGRTGAVSVSLPF